MDFTPFELAVWARAMNFNGMRGPSNGTASLSGQNAADLAWMLGTRVTDRRPAIQGLDCPSDRPFRVPLARTPWFRLLQLGGGGTTFCGTVSLVLHLADMSVAVMVSGKHVHAHGVASLAVNKN